MKLAKWLGIALIVGYIGLVAAFETMIGVLQPTGGHTLVITTREADGAGHDRVLSRIDSGGVLYVAANHWPRKWYSRALQNPSVRIVDQGIAREAVAVPVSGAEAERVGGARPLSLRFRFLTGFPPRRFLRLDPAGDSERPAPAP